MAARQPPTKRKFVIERLLWHISDNGRLALMTGLGAGLILPGLAAALQPWLPEMVALLLVITSLRIGHRAVLHAMSDLRWSIGAVLMLQLLLPLVLLALCFGLGLAQTPLALALVLATAAPALSGSPNMALMLGQDAGRMMQLLVLGTALFPLTVLPLLIAMPQLGDPQEVAIAALTLLGVILLAAALGFGLRAVLFRAPSVGQVKALDGLSVLAFSAIVIGLMAALNPALRSDPGLVVQWAAFAFVLSYGVQIGVLWALRRSRFRDVAGPLAIGAGNRNIALFLVALPDPIMAPLMIFVGCWQLPMYLTPILLRRVYGGR